MKSLKEKLRRGSYTIGSWIMAGNTLTTEIIASFRFDWLAIDMEHSAFSEDNMIKLIQIIELSGVAPLVRVGDNDPLLIKRAMDAGAHGVIVPMVNSFEDAKRAVDAVYYSPKGNRGVGLGRASRYGLRFDEYRKWLSSNAVVIAQIEHKSAMEKLEEILSVEGIDASMIGPYDLSASMGFPGEFERPEVKNFVKKYLQVSRKVNKPAGFHVVEPNAEFLNKKIKDGFCFLAFGTDALFLGKNIENQLKRIKQ